jgi:uncharacterized protein (DUF1499 family)
MILFILSPLAVLVCGTIALAWWSHRVEPTVGPVEGRLRSCPETPNCVCSEPGTRKDVTVVPLPFSDEPALAWDRAKAAVRSLGGTIERESDTHLWATFRTTLLRFVDDLELRLDHANNVIHVRSASRVGRSDFGQNRRRVEALRARFAALH